MKKVIMVIMLCFAFGGVIFATGDSWMTSIIQPVSVNQDGVILCKTEFEQNSTGARTIMPIEYGWAIVFPDGKIKEYPFHYFDTESYSDRELVFEHYRYLEKIFKAEIDWNNPPVSLLPLIDQYKFNSNNAKKYLVDKEMKLEEFLKRYNLRISEAVQRTLRNHYSIKYNENIHVLYVIDKLVFLKNYTADEDYTIVGAEFDFYVSDRKTYETFNITGIIKLK